MKRPAASTGSTSTKAKKGKTKSNTFDDSDAEQESAQDRVVYFRGAQNYCSKLFPNVGIFTRWLLAVGPSHIICVFGLHCLRIAFLGVVGVLLEVVFLVFAVVGWVCAMCLGCLSPFSCWVVLSECVCPLLVLVVYSSYVCGLCVSVEFGLYYWVRLGLVFWG
jgi:uncharacterized oligopeptide transporter (OPT) family protein